mgnify:FL=1
MLEYAALVASMRALPDGLILVFQHPVRHFELFTLDTSKNSPALDSSDNHMIPVASLLTFAPSIDSFSPEGPRNVSDVRAGGTLQGDASGVVTDPFFILKGIRGLGGHPT